MSLFPPASFHPQHRLGAPEETCGEGRDRHCDKRGRAENIRIVQASVLSTVVFMVLFLLLFLFILFLCEKTL